MDNINEKEKQENQNQELEQIKKSFSDRERRRNEIIKNEFSGVVGLAEVVKDASLDELDRLRTDLNRLNEYGISNDVILSEIKNRVLELANLHNDTMEGINLKKKSFAKEFVKKEILKEVSKEKPELGKIARVSFDVNGLKAVNDLNGGDHSKGDDYLVLAAEIFKKDIIQNWAKENNMQILPTKDGGDEYGVILVSEEAVSRKQLDEFIDLVKIEVNSDEIVEESAKILDFKEDKVQRCFANMRESSWVALDPKKRQEIVSSFEIPADFKFPLRMSAGAINLAEAITVSNKKETKNQLKPGDNLGIISSKVMGALFAESDEQMCEDKKEFKESLGDHDDDSMRFLSKVYSRTKSEMEAKEKLREAQANIETNKWAIKEAEEILKENDENIGFLEEHTDDTHRYLEEQIVEKGVLKEENKALGKKILELQESLDECNANLIRHSS